MNREADLLRSRRKELRLTQQAVAAMIGIQLRQYQRFEYGEQLLSNTSMRLGLLICETLQLDPYKVVFNTDHNPKTN